MTATERRSPSPSVRHLRCRRACAAAGVGLALAALAVPLACVGALSSRGHRAGVYVGDANLLTPLHPSSRSRQLKVDGSCTDQSPQHSPDLPLQRSTSTSRSVGWVLPLKRLWSDASWGRLSLSNHREEEPSEFCVTFPAPPCRSAESGAALDLASTARGGGGPRGWWFPGRNARRRRNLERAAQRGASKRAAAKAAAAAGEPALPRGLANQGNTCYLNSLLQTLYHAPGLREAVLDAWEGGGAGGNGDGGDDAAATVSGLATVFRQLDQGGRPVSTVPLTRAMGVDPRVQQDAQEFGRFLFLALESAEARPVEDEGEGGEGEGKAAIKARRGLSDAIKELFAGRLVNYIECVNLPFSKEQEEVFYDLPLDVKGSGTLQKSLDRFVEAELMTGDNRWRAGEHGLQEARKGVRFLELPAVLQFHLKRFEYDPYRDDLAKVNDRFEFPTELDMLPWLQQQQQQEETSDADAAPPDVDARAAGSSKYELSAVVMHVGGPSAGHYYAYVRYDNQTPPSRHHQSGDTSAAAATATATAASSSMATRGSAGSKGRGRPKSTPTWVKLDDHRVTRVSEAQVLRDAFGGGGGMYEGPGAELQSFFGQGFSGGGGTASAYMLQYVRQDQAEGRSQAQDQDGDRDQAARASRTEQTSEREQP